DGVHLQVLVPGLHHDVDSLDLATAAHRPGDDDVPEISAAHQLRAASGRGHVAAVLAASRAEDRLVGHLRRVHAGPGDDDLAAVALGQRPAQHRHARRLAPDRRPRLPGPTRTGQGDPVTTLAQLTIDN